MHQILTEKGHKCLAAFVGISKFRNRPLFFDEYFHDKITEFESPNFIRDKNDRSILILRSLMINLFRARTYFKSIRKIHRSVKKLEPNLIISFYEPLTGLYRLFYKRHIPCISVAHQFGWQYTGYISSGTLAERSAIRFLTNISGFGSDLLFCINPIEINIKNKKKLVFIPPLIRNEIKNAAVSDNGSITGYLLNKGYKEEILVWHSKHPDQEINCFMDVEENDNPKVTNLNYNPISDRKFIQTLASSTALVTTAGYESITEAMYLGKPVLMVPVKNHFEQALNAVFFEKLGAGVRSAFFDIDKLLNFTFGFKPVISFREWTDKGPEIIEKQISKLFDKERTEENGV